MTAYADIPDIVVLTGWTTALPDPPILRRRLPEMFFALIATHHIKPFLPLLMIAWTVWQCVKAVINGAEHTHELSWRLSLVVVALCVQAIVLTAYWSRLAKEADRELSRAEGHLRAFHRESVEGLQWFAEYALCQVYKEIRHGRGHLTVRDRLLSPRSHVPWPIVRPCRAIERTFSWELVRDHYNAVQRRLAEADYLIRLAVENPHPDLLAADPCQTWNSRTTLSGTHFAAVIRLFADASREYRADREEYNRRTAELNRILDIRLAEESEARCREARRIADEAAAMAPELARIQARLNAEGVERRHCERMGMLAKTRSERDKLRGLHDAIRRTAGSDQLDALMRRISELEEFMSDLNR